MLKTTNFKSVTVTQGVTYDTFPPGLQFNQAASTPGCHQINPTNGDMPYITCGEFTYAPGQEIDFTLVFTLIGTYSCGDVC